jgi:lactate dehydrogenase-like 2-hydroxyacid dehydrogenase
MKKKNNLLIITHVSHLKGFLLKAKKYFKVKYLPDISVKNFQKISKDYDYVFTNPNMTNIYLGSKNLLNSKLKAICTASTGTIHIDKNFLKKKKIKLISLTNEKKLLSKLTSTAELAFGFTLDAIRNITSSSQSVKNGNWNYTPFIGRMMYNQKVLVIGYGRLGQMYSKYCLAFGSKVYVYDPFKKIKNQKIIVVKNLKNILKNVNIISLNIHAEKNNINLINKSFLKNVKKDVIIINTSRGEIVDEKCLLGFLKKNELAKYFTDVLTNEIKFKNNLLFRNFNKMRQILITPHIGGMTIDGQSLAFDHALDLLIKYNRKYN